MPYHLAARGNRERTAGPPRGADAKPFRAAKARRAACNKTRHTARRKPEYTAHYKAQHAACGKTRRTARGANRRHKTETHAGALRGHYRGIQNGRLGAVGGLCFGHLRGALRRFAERGAVRRRDDSRDGFTGVCQRREKPLCAKLPDPAGIGESGGGAFQTLRL